MVRPPLTDEQRAEAAAEAVERVAATLRADRRAVGPVPRTRRAGRDY